MLARQEEDLSMEEREHRWRPTFFGCFQEVAGMFKSLTCSSTRTLKGRQPLGPSLGQDGKAFSIRMQMLEGLQGFSSQPSGMEESLGI